ncbi:hypothetical protein PMZ80_007036 [Knufia obscura]|uniref:Uncharacterized protein n=2 Tax=Knufia TaxID=430999 RepID=A0AAN8I8G9_9EURO|nr:hypothetical protein PMZ80_007036 [Knufia obscura]KAK5953045.1 hypothetical protein OHC33_005613 [Knufia fluminis]
MATKRKRSSQPVSSFRKSKRLRCSEPVQLPQLPPEIWSMIVALALKIPNTPSCGVLPDITMTDLFSTPLLHLNRTFRQMAIDRIAKDCLWIEVVASERRYIRGLERESKRTPLLDKIWDDVLPQSRSTLAIQLGRANNASQRTRSFKRADTRIVFAFNYQSFMYLYSNIKLMQGCRKGMLDHLSIKCTPMPASLQRILQEQIVPLISKIRCLTSFHQEGFNHFSAPDIERMTTRPATIPLAYLEGVFAVTEAVRLRELGLEAEAGLFALHIGPPLIQLAGQALPHPAMWVALNMSKPDWSSDTIARLLLATVRLIQGNEQAAYIAYGGWSDTNPSWADNHAPNLSMKGSRWIEEPLFTWFGLPDVEMAEMHSTAALMYRRLAATAFDKHGPHSFGARWHMQEAVRRFKLAAKLDPDDLSHQERYEYYRSLARARYDIGILDNLYHCDSEKYTDADGVSSVVYGLDSSLRDWGSEALPFLRRAQEIATRSLCVTSDDDSDDDEMSEHNNTTEMTDTMPMSNN